MEHDDVDREHHEGRERDHVAPLHDAERGRDPGSIPPPADILTARQFVPARAPPGLDVPARGVEWQDTAPRMRVEGSPETDDPSPRKEGGGS